MKVTPIAQGTGVPANGNSTPLTADKIQRAKAIAAGLEPQAPQEQQPSGDPQVDRMKRIKMRTQVSTNRHENSGGDLTMDTIETTRALMDKGGLPVDPDSPTADVSEPAEVVEETKPLSPQFAALARQKRALQLKEAELAKREAELGQQSSPNLDEYIPKADLLANPLKIFEAGLTYDQLTEAILSSQNGGSQELAELKSYVKSLEEKIEGKFNDRDTQSEQQVLREMRRTVDAMTADGEEYEAIRQAGAQDQVIELIHRTWKQTGEILDEREAAELVENQLVDEALPFARIKKVQSKLTPQQAEVLQQQLAPKAGTKVMRTLTNRDGARPGGQDRRSRALAAFAGTLKRG